MSEPRPRAKRYTYICYPGPAKELTAWARRNGIRSRIRPKFMLGLWRQAVTVWVPGDRPDLPEPTDGMTLTTRTTPSGAPRG